MHGYSIAARLEQFSGGALRVNLGTLYPGLRRLEQRGLVRARWDVTDTNRKARFYAITTAGRHQLATEKAEWDRSSSIVHTLLREHDDRRPSLQLVRRAGRVKPPSCPSRGQPIARETAARHGKRNFRR